MITPDKVIELRRLYDDLLVLAASAVEARSAEGPTRTEKSKEFDHRHGEIVKRIRQFFSEGRIGG